MEFRTTLKFERFSSTARKNRRNSIPYSISFEEEEEGGEIVNLADSRMDCLRGCLATLSVLVVRIALLAQRILKIFAAVQ